MSDRKDRNSDQTRVRFERGLPARMMAIDGTWQRECVVNDVAEAEATITLSASIQGLALTEFFLLLSSVGVAYRRCSLAWVNGDQIGVSFVRPGKKSGKPPKKRDEIAP